MFFANGPQAFPRCRGDSFLQIAGICRCSSVPPISSLWHPLHRTPPTAIGPT